MVKDINEFTMAEAYQPLFNLMANEYGKNLVKSEMDEIIEAVEKVNENVSELWRVVCDVEGCDQTASTQGMYYREIFGYCCLCSKHSSEARKKTGVPTFKPDAIEREKRRKPD